MNPYHLEFEAIGTAWSIDVFDASAVLHEQLTERIHDRIKVFDRTYSRFREDSIIAHIAQSPGVYTLHDDFQELYTIYNDLYRLSDGLFTPMIGNVLTDAGYDAGYSLQAKKLSEPLKFHEVMHYDYPTLTVKEASLLDFGAAGKGYLVDLVGLEIEKLGCHTYCIDASGDILYKTQHEKALRIGLEDPRDTSRVIGVAEIKNQSICGSAGNRRKWGDFHHIINPKTLTSPSEILAVWVISRKGLLADALATCLFFIPPEKLLSYYEFEYVILNADSSVTKSKTFSGELFVTHREPQYDQKD
jgi:FAD:protein FMN transferase